MFHTGQLVRISDTYFKYKGELGTIVALRTDGGGEYAQVRLLNSSESEWAYPNLEDIEDSRLTKDLKEYM
jgi:hypothetical protein